MPVDRHARTTLWALLVAATLTAPAGRASEQVPKGNWAPEFGKRLDTYGAASAHSLKNVLTPMVEKTTQGEEYLGSQWQREAARILKLLQVLNKPVIQNPDLKRWYDAEVAAWKNIDTIGKELLDFHYQMASTVEEIEDDTDDSKAYFSKFKECMGKANTDAGYISDSMDAASKAVKDLDKFSGAVGKLTTYLALLSDHSQTVARLCRSFHKRQVEFIKDRGRLDKHREGLDKLKNKKLDPDQTGAYVEFEKRWEETMYKTYRRYEDAVEEWREVNRWHDGKEQLYNTLANGLPKVVNSLSGDFLGQSLPPFLPRDAEELDEHLQRLRKAYIKAVEAFKGKNWAEIEKLLADADEERRELRVEFEQTLKKIEMDARMKVAKADEECEKVVKPLEAELNRLGAQATREASAEAREAIYRKIRDINAQIDSAERSLAKVKRHYLGDWQEDEEEKAYKVFREAIRKIDDRIKELQGERSKVERIRS